MDETIYKEWTNQVRINRRKFQSLTIPECSTIRNILLQFIRQQNRILYGGMSFYCISDTVYDLQNTDCPDLEFYSPTPQKDMYKIAQLLYTHLGKAYDIQGKTAKHENTFKIFVNSEEVCDITAIHPILFKLKERWTTLDSTFQCRRAANTWMLVDILRQFNDPWGSYWRLGDKLFKKAFPLLKHFSLPVFELSENPASYKKTTEFSDDLFYEQIQKTYPEKTFIYDPTTFDTFINKNKNIMRYMLPYDYYVLDLFPSDQAHLPELKIGETPMKKNIQSPFFQFWTQSHVVYTHEAYVVRLFFLSNEIKQCLPFHSLSENKRPTFVGYLLHLLISYQFEKVWKKDIFFSSIFATAFSEILRIRANNPSLPIYKEFEASLCEEIPLSTQPIPKSLLQKYEDQFLNKKFKTKSKIIEQQRKLNKIKTWKSVKESSRPRYPQNLYDEDRLLKWFSTFMELRILNYKPQFQKFIPFETIQTSHSHENDHNVPKNEKQRKEFIKFFVENKYIKGIQWIKLQFYDPEQEKHIKDNIKPSKMMVDKEFQETCLEIWKDLCKRKAIVYGIQCWEWDQQRIQNGGFYVYLPRNEIKSFEKKNGLVNIYFDANTQTTTYGNGSRIVCYVTVFPFHESLYHKSYDEITLEDPQTSYLIPRKEWLIIDLCQYLADGIHSDILDWNIVHQWIDKSFQLFTPTQKTESFYIPNLEHSQIDELDRWMARIYNVIAMGPTHDCMRHFLCMSQQQQTKQNPKTLGVADNFKNVLQLAKKDILHRFKNEWEFQIDENKPFGHFFGKQVLFSIRQRNSAQPFEPFITFYDMSNHSFLASPVSKGNPFPLLPSLLTKCFFLYTKRFQAILVDDDSSKEYYENVLYKILGKTYTEKETKIVGKKNLK